MGGGGGGSGGGVRECGGNSGKRMPSENGEPYLPKRDILTCVCAVRVHVLLNLRVSLSFFDVFPGLFFGATEGGRSSLSLVANSSFDFLLHEI